LCDYCGERISGLPFKCKYCGGKFCVKHHLPENHECPGLYKAKSLYLLERDEKIGIERERAGPRTATAPGRLAHTPRLNEALHLAAAFMAVAAAIAYPWILLPDGLAAVLTASALALIPHELAHKIAARRLGFAAKFEITGVGLLVTLLSLVSPIKVVMPGYVKVAAIGISRREEAIISLAGPATNMAVSLAALMLPPGVLRSAVLSTSSAIALVNLLPLDGLDGSKIISWKPFVWGLAMIGALAIYMYALGLL